MPFNPRVPSLDLKLSHPTPALLPHPTQGMGGLERIDLRVHVILYDPGRRSGKRIMQYLR